MELLMRGVQYGVGLLLLIVAVNVAILVYARTATRTGEIAVRTALGASRARVVLQLFVEALVPSVLAAALGLGIMHVALNMIRDAVKHEEGASLLPFLVDFRLTPAVVLYVTVARRRREIGIRAALGADARHILAGIFRRAAAQLAAGIALGLAIGAIVDWTGDGVVTGGNTLLLMPGVVAVMTIVGLFAAVVPARRGLAVQPVEALRDE